MECGLDNMCVGILVACTTTRGDPRHDNRNEQVNVGISTLLMTLYWNLHTDLLLTMNKPQTAKLIKRIQSFELIETY